jgi:MoaA/NifB/PqqE/SkfB family radical SAM enzyme
MTTPAPNVASAGALKIASFADRLSDYENRRPVLPITVEIQPTERCNHKCPDCQAHYSLGMKEIRKRAIGGADLDIDQLASLWERPPAGIVISGNTGDPLLHARIADLIETAGRHAQGVFFITNGQAMTPELAELIAANCTVIRISLDGWDAPSFIRAHGRTAEWETVLRSIRMVAAARDRRAALGLNAVEVSVGYLTDERSAAGIVEAARISRDHGANLIQFRPYHHRAVDHSAELAEARKLETATFRIVASDHKYLEIGKGRGYTRCDGARFATVIDALGDIYMCCHLVGTPTARTGSIYETPWPVWVESHEREWAIRDFDVSGCLPLCRLDAVNKALQRGIVPIRPEVLTADVRRHRNFL